MKNRLRGILLMIAFLLAGSAISQHDISKYSLSGITDPVLPLVTNRIVDTLQQDWMVLLNEIDHRHSLKVFMAVADGDSIYCDKTSDLSLAGLFAQAGQDWVLLIHGDSKMPVDAAVRGLEVQNLHGVKVLVYSWPSMMSTQNGLKNYKNSRGNVEDGMAQFRELLLLVQAYRNSHIWPEGNHLSLFMHSLGNYYLERAVKEDALQGLDEGLFDNIIINAAAVELKGHERWVEKLRIGKRVYVTNNRKDFNLSGARLFTKAGKQLGGPVEAPLASNAIYIDFSEAIGFRLPTWLSHTYFVGEMPRKYGHIKDFYTTILHGREAGLEDQYLFKPVVEGQWYSIRP